MHYPLLYVPKLSEFQIATHYPVSAKGSVMMGFVRRYRTRMTKKALGQFAAIFIVDVSDLPSLGTIDR